MRALVDTGSPVSIVSLKFLLQVLAGKKRENQTPEEWKAEAKQRLKPPTISLRDYGGGELDIVSQIRCRISRRSYTVDGVVHVQKDAPIDLLLGTDLQPYLGFILMECNELVQPANLLPLQSPDGLPSAGTVKETVAKEPTNVCTGLRRSTIPAETTKKVVVKESSATVCVMNATRVPGRHAKVVQAQTESTFESPSLVLFEPGSGLDGIGVSMTDAVIAPGGGESVTLLVENEGHQPVWLEKGQVLGKVEPATLVEFSTERDNPEVEEDQAIAEDVMAVLVEDPMASSSERSQKLLSALEIDQVDLAVAEAKQLEELLLEFLLWMTRS